MRRIVFLLEESSMGDLLEVLLPRLFPGLYFQCVPHEGKQDLEKSITCCAASRTAAKLARSAIYKE